VFSRTPPATECTCGYRARSASRFNPAAAHVEAACRLLAPAYPLPLLVLDATGMRVGELERLRSGSVDEPRGRWRVSRTVAKTGYGRWVSVPPLLYGAVLDLCPRDDRHTDRRVFENSAPTGCGMAISRAAPPPARQRSRRTICATVGSRYCISAVCRGRRSGWRSASVTWLRRRTPIRTCYANLLD
jgi:integrase